MKNTTFDNNFVAILVWMLPNLVSWLTLLILAGHMIVVAMDIILAGNDDFLSYQNVCIYKLGWCSVNTLARVWNHISLERAGHEHSSKACGVCITTLGIQLWFKLCNTSDILCECYHILVHIFLNVAAIQIPHILMECWWPGLSNDIKHNTPAIVLTRHQLSL